jgi:uncharacterized protein YjbI with pentapeptide repeats
LAGHAVFNRVRNAMELLQYRWGSADIAELPAFERNLEAPRLQNWYQDNTPLREWEGVASNDSNEVVGMELRIVDPEHTARHRLPNLEHLIFRGFKRVPQQYIRQISKDYAHNKSLCVDFQGVSELGDAELQVFANAGVRWRKLDISGTSATETGICSLFKNTPDLEVKCFDTMDWMSSREFARTATQLAQLHSFVVQARQYPFLGLLGIAKLDLSNCELEGSIPQSIELCGKLEELNLSGNRLSGELPLAIIKMKSNGVNISLNGNTGFTLPSNIGDLGDITRLDLSNCSLTDAEESKAKLKKQLPNCSIYV